MPKTLLVDTNRAAYPIYKYLCGLGYDVSVIGGKPDEPLAKMSENYIGMDYSDQDKLAALIEQEKYDFFIPGCTDVSYKMCAAVNQGRYPGIDTPEVTSTINDKHAFRRIANALGLSVPRVLNLEEAKKANDIIIKPTDAHSGKGVHVLRGGGVDDITAAIAAAEGASKSNAAIIEEFVSGQLYSHSAFIRDHKIVTDVFVREDCVANSFAVDCSYVDDTPSKEIAESIRRQIEALAGHLNLVDGLLHTQFISNGTEFWLIEVTRRCPGDLYSLLVELSTDYPYAARYSAPFLGQAVEGLGRLARRKYIIRHTVTAPEGIDLWGLRFSRSVHIRLMIPLATAGDRLAPAPTGRAGIFFFEAQNENELAELYEELLNGSLYNFG